jgi:CDP-glucose 4,6-dehydratase
LLGGPVDLAKDGHEVGELGAKVVGYSLPDPPTSPSHFEELALSSRLTADIRHDIRSRDDLQDMLSRFQPDFIFHLAAQPLVRQAFAEPHYTVETNCLGSLNMLEAVRQANRDCIVIMITTDKVYENVEWLYAYRENDPLGGLDPYSASKACAEIIVSSYRRSFFDNLTSSSDTPAIALASVRGGNVIGGGDWAKDRLVPDCIKCLSQSAPIPVRNKRATRPWQHVLELLSGYLHLGTEISRALYPSERRNIKRLEMLCSSFNFGPHITSNKHVEELVETILRHWPGRWEDLNEHNPAHEGSILNLNIDKAYHILGWQPRWHFEEAIKYTVEWYAHYYKKEGRDSSSIRELTQQHIATYAEGPDYSSNYL